MILEELNSLIDYNNSESIKNSLNFINQINEIYNSTAIKKLIHETKKSIYQNLTTERLKDLSSELKNEDIIQALEEHFNDSLESTLKDVLTNHFLKNPHDFNLNAIKYLNIEKIEPFEISKLTPKYIQLLTPDQIKFLTNEHLEALDQNQAKALKSEYVLNLSENQIIHLLTSKKINPALIDRLKPKIIKKIEDQLINLFGVEELQYLTSNQIQELSSTTKLSLLKKLHTMFLYNQSSSVKNIIPSIIYKINNSITFLSPTNFKSYESIVKALQKTFSNIRSLARLKEIDMNYIETLTQEDFNKLDEVEKIDIYQELKNNFQLFINEQTIPFNLDQLFKIISDYKPLEIKILLLKLINDIQSDNQSLLRINNNTLINIIKNLTNFDIKFLKKEYPFVALLDASFYDILYKHYKDSSYEEIQNDLGNYQTPFIKLILIKIANEKKTESSSKNYKNLDISDDTYTKKVTINETKNILHSPRETNSNNDSNSDPTKNTFLKPQDFYAKSITQDHIVLLGDDSYNSLINDIKEYYEDKDIKTIMDDMKFYKSKNLIGFLYELINEKNSSKEQRKSNYLSPRTSLDNSLPSSQAAKSSSDNAQSSTDDFNSSLDENVFHRPQ